MTKKREELIERNKRFIQLRKPVFSEMTDEQLELRASLLEKAFELAFKNED